MNKERIFSKPRKANIVDLMDLSKRVLERQKKETIYYKDAFFEKEKNKVLVRLMHLGSDASPSGSKRRFPIEIGDIEHLENGTWSCECGIGLVKERVSAKQTYEKLTKFLDDINFKSKVDVVTSGKKQRSVRLVVTGVV